MNLHGIASGVISAVNPMQSATLQLCTGYATAADGSRAPAYATARTVRAQVQDLSQRDIMHLNSLNIQGSQKVVYLSGELSGLVRPDGKGGDLLTMSDGSVWLVTAVMEQWPDWCKVSVTLQNGA